ncbi:hypothetical protein D9M68_990060 [compost metagenome]
MGNDENRAARAHLLQVVVNDALGLVVQACGGLVQQQQTRIGGKRPGDGNAGALTTGEETAALANHGVVALGQHIDEVVRTSELGCSHHVFQ